jgi:hypothetical protein
MSCDRKKRLKYLRRFIGGLCLAMLTVLVALKFWIVPSFIRLKVTKALSAVWDSEVTIGNIEVNCFGPIYLKTVTFCDNKDHKWFQADAIKATLKDWPGLHPLVTAIEITKPQVDILFSKGRFLIPFRLSPKQPSGPQKKYFDLKRISANDITLTLSDGRGPAKVFDELILSAARKDNYYNISVTQSTGQLPAVLSISGTINPVNFDTNLSVKLKHTFQKTDVSAILAVLNVPQYVLAQGGLTADLAITGCLKEPDALQPVGAVELDGWRLTVKDRPIVEEITATIRLNGNHFESENFTATFCKGHIDGSLYADVKPHSPAEFGGSFLADKIDLAELTAALSDAQKTVKGTVALKYEFTTAGRELKNLQGTGEIFLDDAELRLLPVIPHIFQAVGLQNFSLLKMSDAAGTFDTTGTDITIKDAHIANRFVAIEAEPDGKINLQNGHVDLYVVGIPFRQIDTLVKSIPVVNLFAGIRDKLVRLHIKGHWSDPPATLITKEPIKDIEEGTVGFLTDAMETGGQFSKKILEKLGILLQKK